MSTIKQKELIVETIGGQKITVRRMRWKAAAQFLRKFAAAYKLIYADKKLDAVKFSADGMSIGADATKGFLTIITELVDTAEDLAAHLASSSTDLSREEFDQLDMLAGFDVLAAAISLNFDDELKKSLAGIGTAAKALIPAPEKTS